VEILIAILVGLTIICTIILVIGLLAFLFASLQAVVLLPLGSVFSWIYIGILLSIGACIGHACFTAFVKFNKWAFNVISVKWTGGGNDGSL
jgi:hypothetical protein